MIQEVIMHTEPSDIPKDYYYDTETDEFYVYRHKYTGDEIHIAKNPPIYVNIQGYVSEALDKIRAEIMKLDDINPDYPMDRTIHISRNEVLQIIDKYKAESEG